MSTTTAWSIVFDDVLSGGNIDLETLRRVVSREL